MAAQTYGEQITIPGLTVAGDLSGQQYRYVRYSTTAADTIIAVGATTEQPIGVLQDAPDASGEAATVAAVGVTLVEAGTSTITRGATLTPDASGRAITGGALSAGRAIDAAGAVGDLIRVVLGGS